MRLNNNASSSTSTSSSFALPAPSADGSSLGIATMAQETTNRGTKRPRLEELRGTTKHDRPTHFPTTTATTTTSSSKQNNNHQIRIAIHFDGGSRGNPGVAGAGAHVIVVEEGFDAKSNTNEYHVRKYCGEHATNNYAEYHGLISGLEVANSGIANLCKISSEETTNLPSIINLEVYGDSNLIIQQMRGIWKCTHANISPLFHQCNALIREMNECIAVATKGIAVGAGRNGRPSPALGECKFVVTFEHIRRHLNGVADGEFQLLALECIFGTLGLLSSHKLSLMQYSTSERGHGCTSILDFHHHLWR
jgi:ribonuclease HI